MTLEKIISVFVTLFVALLFVMSFYLVVVAVPVMAYTEAECLRNGYPKYAVSIGLERYCMNLEGTITVRVEKAKELKK